MRGLTSRLLCAAAVTLLALALGAQSAQASDTDCTGACAFFGGIVVGSIPSTSVGPTNGAWTASFAENVYLFGGVYTYVFDLKLTALGTNESLASISTGLAGGAFNHTLGPGFDYGVVFAGGVLAPTTPPVDDFNPPGFTFTATTIRSFPSNMDTVGRTYEFYAQSTAAPGPGEYDVLNGGTTKIASLDPAPEPSAMLLFGTGHLSFAEILRRRRQVQST
jgi:hypothetical protein